MNKISTVVSLLLVGGSVFGVDRNLTFERCSKPERLRKIVKKNGDVEIAKNGENRVLRLKSPSSSFALETGATSSNFSTSMDFFYNEGASGSIMHFSMLNSSEKYFALMSRDNVLRASTSRGGKTKMRELFTLTPETWYRIEVKVKGRRYSLTVADRGPDNSNQEEKVVYDSKQDGKVLYVNTEVEPQVLSFNHWTKQSGHFIDYDNFVLSSD